MYNQTEAVLSQYELEIRKTLKGRGTYICDTQEGTKTLVSFRGSKEKGEFLKEYLRQINALGFPVEQMIPNKEGAALTLEEGTGEAFLLKDFVGGVEVDTGNPKELEEAVKILANYHQLAKQHPLEIPSFLIDSKASEIGVRQRHYRELIKVKNYIKGRKKKNRFDQIFIQSYDAMVETAKHSLQVLEGQTEDGGSGVICHGDFNQHNVLKTENGWRIVNFENFYYGWGILDFANFLRKIMEKNNWDMELGSYLLEIYDIHCGLEREEYERLYGLLLFPEKFWKVSNHYMNSRKSWISERDIEKLQRVVEQEEVRKIFLQKLFSFLGE